MPKRPIMEVKEGEFLDTELNIIKDNMKSLYIEARDANKFNYFQIYRLYLYGFFLGYAILFAGNLEDNDVYLENLCFFGDIWVNWRYIMEFLNVIKKRPAFGNYIDNIYYDLRHIIPEFYPILDNLGYRVRAIKR